MPKSGKHLLIGSTEAYSGKSATVLGIAKLLQAKGLTFSYGKPLGTCLNGDADSSQDRDVQLLADVLSLPASQLRPTLVDLTETATNKRISGEDSTNYFQKLQAEAAEMDELVVWEGPANFQEGKLFDLSLTQMAEALDASVVLVARFHAVSLMDQLLMAHQQLGDRLVGVVINDIPADQWDLVHSSLQPFLETKGITVLGTLPHSELLRSVRVGELVDRLDADVLCCPERMDLMVETLTIGAMNVSSALKYFRKGKNKAVVTGGDRTDLQLAALETSTQCLILTGHITPDERILSRAEDVEVPILSVELETLTTVEIIDHAFGQVRLQEPIKVNHVVELMTAHFKGDRFLETLGLGD